MTTLVGYPFEKASLGYWRTMYKRRHVRLKEAIAAHDSNAIKRFHALCVEAETNVHKREQWLADHSAKTRPGIPVADLTGISDLHPTEGLAGYPAHDYFAPAGSDCVAPVSGVIARFSGHDPAQGPVEGPHGPFGWSIYIDGDNHHSYYLTHLGSRSTAVGARVHQGQVIGTVGDYARWTGTPDHIHMGVH